MSRFPFTEPEDRMTHVVGQSGRRTRRRRVDATKVESVIDDLVALERIAGNQQFGNGLWDVEDLERRTELVMEIERRRQEIQDEARDRTVNRRLHVTKQLLPVVLTIVAALLSAAAVVVALLAVNRAEFDEIVHWIVSLHGVPIGTVVALLFGGGTVAAGSRLKRKENKRAIDDEDGRDEEEDT